MSKVSTYLQEHILGEVSTNPNILGRYSTDMSILAIKPEMVVYPRVTNDIRKILRFSWQLAEKGHTLAITVRGGGSDETGAGLGAGIIVDPTHHMRQIFEYDTKQKLVRLQPGVTTHALEESLRLRGASIPPLVTPSTTATVGGAVANNTANSTEVKYGRMMSWVSQLEVVLANGDILQTGKLSKRDLNRKKGLQTMEGEIYRGIDNLIDDNKELLASIAVAGADVDCAGYPGLARVKKGDGFDLTPLIVGSQGTLGVISEMILKSEFTGFQDSVALLAFADKADARDAFDVLVKFGLAYCEYYDGAYFVEATKHGKRYEWFDAATHGKGAVIICGFDDFSERVRAKKLKRLQKSFARADVTLLVDAGETADGLLSARDVVAVAQSTETGDQSYPPVFDNFYVPAQRFEEFVTALEKLAQAHGIGMPLYGDVLAGIYSTRPLLHLRRVGDKQKVFKLLDEVSNLINHHEGALVGRDGEGRLKSKFAYKYQDKETRDLYEAVRAIFDPHSTLNPGVKSDIELRSIAGSIRNEY